jgi:hypothetical protein
MNRKVVLVAAICVGLAMSHVAWVHAGPPVPPVGTVNDKIYNILDPRGLVSPIPYVGLAPRLTSIAGKTILVDQGEADAIIMPALYQQLKATYPSTNWLYVAVSSFGPSAIEPEYLASKPDAIIRGVAW